MSRRHLVLATFVALGAVVAAACQPVTAPPPPPPPPPQVSFCSEPVTTPGGKTQFYAMVDDGGGLTEAVTFDAATPAEKQADIAQIEETQGDVVAVEVDQVVHAAAATPGDEPLYLGNPPFTAPGQTQWGIDQATFPAAWSNVASLGSGVTVAVIDTGVQITHPDLALPGGFAAGTDLIAPGDGTNDQNGHGTHVAGILGARDQDVGGIGGVPIVTIMPVRVLNASGSGSYAGVINGINYAVTNGADVISMSLGGAGSDPNLAQAVANAIANGVVVVAAAGNDGSCSALYPAVYSGVIAVAATEVNSDTLATFSQRGPNVDIAAPGRDIWSTVPNSAYGRKSGTSMATPFVSAAAALVLAKCTATGPWITRANRPGLVEARLEATAAPIAGNPIQQTPIAGGSLRAGAATAAAC